MVAEQSGVAPSPPTAHNAAQDGRSRQVGVEMLEKQLRRESLRIRQQQMEVVRGRIESVTGEQAT